MAKTAPKKQPKPKAVKPQKKPAKPAATKQNISSKPGSSPVKSFFRFLFSKWVRRTVLLIAILALLFWQWDNIYNWITVTVTDAIGVLGWG
jgi:hypothetical protein